MRLLIANDDGIYSPGIAALAEAAAKFGDVRVVAPDVEQSSAGHAITASRPLSYRRTPIKGFEAYRVNGTPADCVALGAYNWEKVDVVLSGINLGSNLGNAMWHSGTLAAAKQAVLLGLRGIALSAPVTRDEPEFDILKPSLEKVLVYCHPNGGGGGGHRPLGRRARLRFNDAAALGLNERERTDPRPTEARAQLIDSFTCKNNVARAHTESEVIFRLRLG